MRAILTWHSIDPSGSPISVSREEFQRQVAWLAAGRVRVVSIEELLRLPDHASAVALTFDDGFANFATEAAPLLESHQLPVTLFIVTARVGRDSLWSGDQPNGSLPVLPLLDWEALGRLRGSGVALGAHTRTHRRLPDLDDAALDEELSLAADEMEHRLGDRPVGLAYPYGATDQRVTKQASRHYRWACTTSLRALGHDESPWLLPRIDAWYLRNPGLLASWGSARFRAWIWYRRQVRRVRGFDHE